MRYRRLRRKRRNRKIPSSRIRAKTSANSSSYSLPFRKSLSAFFSDNPTSPPLSRVRLAPLDEDGRPNHQFIITRRVRRHLSEYYAALWSSAMRHDGNNSRPEGKREDAFTVTASFVRSFVRRETSFSVISPAGCPLAIRLCSPL